MSDERVRVVKVRERLKLKGKRHDGFSDLIEVHEIKAVSLQDGKPVTIKYELMTNEELAAAIVSKDCPKREDAVRDIAAALTETQKKRKERAH